MVYNQGDDPIEDASLSLVMPTHEAFFVASKLPKLLSMDEYMDRSSTELADYPTVNMQDNLVHVCSTLGQILPNAPAPAFEIPLRFCVGSALKGRKIAIRYSLFGRNLRKPATGRLRLIF